MDESHSDISGSYKLPLKERQIHSDISGFYKLPLKERQIQLAKLVNLKQQDIDLLQTVG